MISSNTFADIIEFSIQAHKGQVRKGNGSPYITHPLSVAHRVMAIKRNSRNIWLLAGCSMLHDTVEDTDVTVDQIAERFGHSVASIVSELTLDKTQYGENDNTKAKYLSEHMEQMSSYALTIKLCDRLDNICDMKDMTQDFVDRYIEETLYILSYLERVRTLTKTQKKLVKKIYKEMNSYS